MRRLLLMGACLLPVVLLAFATDAAASGDSHKVRFETVLIGANERPTPATGSDLTGVARVTIDLRTNEVCWRLDYDTTQTVIAAHIHRGGAGTAGPIIFGFFNPPASSVVINKGCRMAASAAELAVLPQIAANPGGFYVNVHTTIFPGGAGRGQLSTELDG